MPRAAKMPEGFVLDMRRDPFHLQVIANRFTYAEVDAHFSEVEASYARYFATRPHVHVGLLADARCGVYADTRTRQRVAQAFARVAAVLSEHHSVAHAVVTNNALTRGALTAVLWLFSPPWPIRVFTSMSEADSWLRDSFTARRVSAPFPPRGWWREAGLPA
jgi:hypothetical protein